MDNIVLEKSKEFAIRVVNLYKYLCEDKKEFVLSKQQFNSIKMIVKSLKNF